MADRLTSSKPGGSTAKRPASNRPGAGPPLKSKADKRLEAKAARARARAAEKRRKVLLAVGAVVVVVLLIVAAVVLFSSKKSTTTPTASGSASAAPSSTAFPPVPAGADPALRTKPTATAGTGTVTKLLVTTLVTGKGDAVQSGQTINVNYVGVTYKDGKEFDSSWSRSQAFSFQVGAGKVIPGWDQGLVGVKVGSRVQLDIPSDLAYGDTPSQQGAPAGTLRFIVDVLSAA